MPDMGLDMGHMKTPIHTRAQVPRTKHVMTTTEPLKSHSHERT